MLAKLNHNVIQERGEGKHNLLPGDRQHMNVNLLTLLNKKAPRKQA